MVYVWPTQPGPKHDQKQADEAGLVYPTCATLGQDTGFQGYKPPGLLVWQPKKKPKGQALSVADKFLNAILSAARISIKHILSGVKRCRIVKGVLRYTKVGFCDRVLEVACALHNLRVHSRHPLPTFRLIDLALNPYPE